MDNVLKAPRDEAITKLYAYLASDLTNLKLLDSQPLANTPLHSAADKGRTDLALEIQRLMPSFARKLNLHGDSPLDLALRRQRADTVFAMVKLNPQLVRVQGKGGITPLHYVAETDDVDLLAKFLQICPDSIQVLTNRGESAVHVAVRNGKLKAVKLLLGWLKRTGRKKVLAWKDLEGNTVLHLAASNNNSEMIKLLVKKVSINTKNSKELTALDIADSCHANDEIMQILKQKKAKHGSSFVDIGDAPGNTFVDYLSSPITITEKILKLNAYFEYGLSSQMRDSILVVAILIVTATFQTSLNPPGGFSDQTPSPAVTNVTTTITSRNVTSTVATTTITNGSNVTSTADEDGKVAISYDSFLKLSTLNSVALAASLGTILLALPASPSTYLLYVSLLCLMISYAFGVRVITPQPHGRTIAVIMFLCYIGFLFIFYIKMQVFRMIFGCWPSTRMRMRYQIWFSRVLAFYKDYYSKRPVD